MEMVKIEIEIKTGYDFASYRKDGYLMLFEQLEREDQVAILNAFVRNYSMEKPYLRAK